MKTPKNLFFAIRPKCEPPGYCLGDSCKIIFIFLHCIVLKKVKIILQRSLGQKKTGLTVKKMEPKNR